MTNVKNFGKAKCYKLTCTMSNFLNGARMYKFFSDEKEAEKDLGKFNGRVEEQELKENTIKILDYLFKDSDDKSFFFMIPDGKKISADELFKKRTKDWNVF